MVRSRCSHQVRRFHADGIRHHRAANTVCEQHPRLAFRHSEGLHALCELQSIGFLCPAPTAIASSLDLYGSLFHRGEDVVTVNRDGRVLVVVLARDGLSVRGVDVDGRHLCPIRQPIDMHTNATSVRMHEVLVVRLCRQNLVTWSADEIIDVFVEAQTVAHFTLKLFVDINDCFVFGESEDGCEAFSYGSNRSEDCVAHYLAIYCPEELVVCFLREPEPVEGWEICWRLFAHGIHLGEVVFVGPVEIGLDEEFPFAFVIIGNVFERIGFQSSV